MNDMITLQTTKWNLPSTTSNFLNILSKCR